VLEYDEMRDCPDDQVIASQPAPRVMLYYERVAHNPGVPPQRSLSMLRELGGGCVRQGSLDVESTGFIKKFERKHAAVWPREYKKRAGLASPLLFLYDSEHAPRPHRVYSLAGMVLSNPPKPSKVRKTPSWPRSWANFSLL
jgi:hypothetical protein